jgi:hypothetical protein
MPNTINKTFCENTIKVIEKDGYFKAWHPDRVAKRLNDYLNEEKYIGVVSIGSVMTINKFYIDCCLEICDCHAMCKEIVKGS